MSDRETIADEIERHIAGFFTRDGMTEAAINAFAQCVMDNRQTVLAALRSQGREDGAREMRERAVSHIASQAKNCASWDRWIYGLLEEEIAALPLSPERTEAPDGH